MAKQLVPDTAIFRVRQRFTPGVGPTVEIENELYARDQVAGWNTGHLTTVATRIGNAWRDNVMPLVSNELGLIEIAANDLGSDPGDVAVVAYGTIGGQVGQMVSPALAVLARWTLTPGAEPRRSHLFIAGGRETQIDGNFWQDAFRIALQTALNAVRGAVAGVTEAHVGVSRVKNKVKRPVGVSNTITGVVLPSITATQRDRRT